MNINLPRPDNASKGLINLVQRLTVILNYFERDKASKDEAKRYSMLNSL